MTDPTGTRLANPWDTAEPSPISAELGTWLAGAGTAAAAEVALGGVAHAEPDLDLDGPISTTPATVTFTPSTGTDPDRYTNNAGNYEIYQGDVRFTDFTEYNATHNSHPTTTRLVDPDFSSTSNTTNPRTDPDNNATTDTGPVDTIIPINGDPTLTFVANPEQNPTTTTQTTTPETVGLVPGVSDPDVLQGVTELTPGTGGENNHDPSWSGDNGAATSVDVGDGPDANTSAVLSDSDMNVLVATLDTDDSDAAVERWTEAMVGPGRTAGSTTTTSTFTPTDNNTTDNTTEVSVEDPGGTTVTVDGVGGGPGANDAAVMSDSDMNVLAATLDTDDSDAAVERWTQAMVGAGQTADPNTAESARTQADSRTAMAVDEDPADNTITTADVALPGADIGATTSNEDDITVPAEPSGTSGDDPAIAARTTTPGSTGLILLADGRPADSMVVSDAGGLGILPESLVQQLSPGPAAPGQGSAAGVVVPEPEVVTPDTPVGAITYGVAQFGDRFTGLDGVSPFSDIDPTGVLDDSDPLPSGSRDWTDAAREATLAMGPPLREFARPIQLGVDREPAVLTREGGLLASGVVSAGTNWADNTAFMRTAFPSISSTEAFRLAGPTIFKGSFIETQAPNLQAANFEDPTLTTVVNTGINSLVSGGVQMFMSRFDEELHRHRVANTQWSAERKGLSFSPSDVSRVFTSIPSSAAPTWWYFAWPGSVTASKAATRGIMENTGLCQPAPGDTNNLKDICQVVAGGTANAAGFLAPMMLTDLQKGGLAKVRQNAPGYLGFFATAFTQEAAGQILTRDFTVEDGFTGMLKGTAQWGSDTAASVQDALVGEARPGSSAAVNSLRTGVAAGEAVLGPIWEMVSGASPLALPEEAGNLARQLQGLPRTPLISDESLDRSGQALDKAGRDLETAMTQPIGTSGDAAIQATLNAAAAGGHLGWASGQRFLGSLTDPFASEHYLAAGGETFGDQARTSTQLGGEAARRAWEAARQIGPIAFNEASARSAAFARWGDDQIQAARNMLQYGDADGPPPGTPQPDPSPALRQETKNDASYWADQGTPQGPGSSFENPAPGRYVDGALVAPDGTRYRVPADGTPFYVEIQLSNGEPVVVILGVTQ